MTIVKLAPDQKLVMLVRQVVVVPGQYGESVRFVGESATDKEAAFNLSPDNADRQLARHHLTRETVIGRTVEFSAKKDGARKLIDMRFEQAAKFSFTISRSILSDALRKLLAVVPTKATVLSTACVLIDVRESVESLIADAGARADTIVMTATNLDATVTLNVGASVIGSGVAALPAKRLADIVANLPAAASITIAVDGTTAKLKAGRTSYDIVGLPPKEFPLHEPMRDAEPISLVASTFVNALTRAVKFTPDESKASQRVLTAVCVQVENGKVLVVGTTGHIFVRLVAGVAEGAKETPQYLIDRDSMSGIVRLFGTLPDGALIRFAADENRASLASGDDRLEIRLLDGPYPNYRMLVKLEPTRTIVCDRELLAMTLRRVALITEGDMRYTEGSIASDTADELCMSAATPDTGKAEDVVAINSRDNHGDSARGPFRFAFNAVKLLAAVETHAAGELALSFNTADHAIHIRPVGDPSDLLTLSLAMPLRIKP